MPIVLNKCDKFSAVMTPVDNGSAVDVSTVMTYGNTPFTNVVLGLKAPDGSQSVTATYVGNVPLYIDTEIENTTAQMVCTVNSISFQGIDESCVSLPTLHLGTKAPAPPVVKAPITATAPAPLATTSAGMSTTTKVVLGTAAAGGIGFGVWWFLLRKKKG